MTDYKETIERLKIVSGDALYYGGEEDRYYLAFKDAITLLQQYREGLERLADNKDFEAKYKGDDPVLYRESCEDARIEHARKTLEGKDE